MKIQKTIIKSKALPTNLTGLAVEHPKGKKWDRLKADNKRIENAYLCNPSAKNKALAKRLFDCSSFLEFQTNQDRSQWKLSKASFCHVRLCPMCQWRRSLVWQKRFIDALPAIQQAQPKARFLFLTLTVKNCDVADTRQTLKDLGQAFKRLTLLKAWPATGWLRTFEITKGKDGTAHPHIHALLMVKPSYFQGSQYIKHDKWAEMWQECARLDYFPQVNVQVVKAKENATEGVLSPLASALLEVFKYSVKPSDLYECPDFLDELTRQLKGVRSVGLGGLFKDHIKSHDQEPELEELEGVHIENPASLFYLYYPTFEQYARNR